MITSHLPIETVNRVYSKLLEHIETNNYAELARRLGFKSRQHLDNIKSKGRLPATRIIAYAIKEGIDFNWLFTSVEPLVNKTFT